MRTLMVLGLVLLSGAGSVRAQQKLEWKWKAGESFYVNTTRQVQQKLTIQDPGGDAKKSREVTQTYDVLTRARYTVKSKDASGTAIVEQLIEGMDIRGKGTLLPVQAVQDASLTFHVNARGEVTKVEGYEALIKKLADQTAERDFLRDAFSAETLRQSLAEMFDFLPVEPVKSGANWTRKGEYKLGKMGTLTVNRTFTLTGDEKRDDRTVSRIEMKAKSVQTLEKDKREVEASGTLYFDAERGRLAAADLKRTTRSALTLTFDERKHPTELEQTETITVQVSDRAAE